MIIIIMDSYSCQHAILTRVLNLASLQCRGGDLSPDILLHVDMRSRPLPELFTCKWILVGGWDDISNLDNFSRVLGVFFHIVCCKLI